MTYHKIYFSPTGGTKKVMDILAEGWDIEKKELDLSVPTDERTILQREDICFIGVPVFEGRVPMIVLERLKAIAANGAYAVPVAVYGARAVDDALLELTDVLAELGFRCCAAIAAIAEHSILHIYGQGRPNAEDREALLKISEKIRTLYEAGELPQKVEVPGKRPYVEMGGISLYPTGNANCVQCGQCATGCPVGAISGPNFAQTDGDKCIRCMRCVANCPTHARDFDPQLMKAVQVQMAKAFEGERHNELFLQV